MFAVSLAILTQEFHGRERGTAFGIWGATIGAAVAIGPLVGGALTEWAGWRWIFFVNLPIGAACVAGAWAYLHESRDEEHGGFDWLGFAFLTGGLFSLVLALLRGESWGWGSGKTLGFLVAAVVLLFGFAAAELRQSVADVRLRALPQAVVHRRADRRVHDLVLDVRDVPLPDALPPEAAALLADPGRASLPAALADLVRRRADRGTAVDAHSRAHPLRRRHVARRRRAPADARAHAVVGLDARCSPASSSAASASAS